MEYQNQKIRAIGRLTIVAAALTLTLALCLIYPDQLRSFAQNLPLPRLRDKYIWLGVLATMVPVCWAVDLVLIFTSPEQEVRLVAWSKRWLKTTSDFERINFDTLDPDYRKVAWRYFLDRRRG
ncbi:hypothetical protein G4G27_23755 [Sphingomonas sp. So64.6b]|uniref:hypothetical protein n=1 Tax=Sphingomonas sp. So64.6b TaxID=2997354 RepID=UPI001601C7D6|nr:hypothetical protein [Sphingomonas sp. So64.6b]QNA86656.1 hypothetical protein G4G27_23755 [Sphingomonas sp. So64.6b]